MSQVSTVSSSAYTSNSPSSSKVRPAYRRQIGRLSERVRQQDEQLKLLRRENRELELENHSLAEQLRLERASNQSPSLDLSNDRPLSGHQFGVRLIALCIELAQRVGFRSTAFVIEKVFQTLGLDLKVPSHDAIEQWTLRLGVAELQDTFTKEQDVLWMADHSSQTGKAKCLLIVGIALEDLPPPGQCLDMEKLKVLAVVPGEKCKKEDVEREYQKLARRIGAPVYLLCDGASELRDAAENLKKDGKKTVVLNDLKHYAANLLEKQVGRSERFKAFMTEVGLTRNRVQQTELSHFSPPPLRQKSRFMNLSNLLGWGRMVLCHLNDPDSPSRQGITSKRMKEKLGWLEEFAEDLASWSECQNVIDRSLRVINEQGLSIDAADELHGQLWPWLDCEDHAKQPVNYLAEGLYQFVNDSVAKLRSDTPRAWLSTEILESLFGRFKRLERQHARGGFTRLVAAFPTLGRKIDASLIRRRFATTKANDVKEWLKSTLRTTLTARRNTAYRHCNTQATSPNPK